MCLVDDADMGQGDTTVETAANNNQTSQTDGASGEMPELPPPGTGDGSGRYFKLKRNSEKFTLF